MKSLRVIDEYFVNGRGRIFMCLVPHEQDLPEPEEAVEIKGQCWKVRSLELSKPYNGRVGILVSRAPAQ